MGGARPDNRPVVSNRPPSPPVLLVGDDAEVRDLFGHLLELRGHTVLSASSAAELGSVADGVVPITLRVVTLGTNERVRAHAPSGGWLVQAGAFASEANALALRDRLAARYPNPYLEEFQGLKRVKFGPYATRAEAEAARDSLTEMGLAGVVAR